MGLGAEGAAELGGVTGAELAELAENGEELAENSVLEVATSAELAETGEELAENSVLGAELAEIGEELAGHATLDVEVDEDERSKGQGLPRVSRKSPASLMSLRARRR